MRWIAAVLWLSLCLAVPCSAREGEPSVAGLDELYRAAEDYGVAPDAGLEAGLRGLLEVGGDGFLGLVRQGTASALRLLAVALLCGLAQGAGLDWGRGGLSVTEIAGALGVFAIAVTDMESMIGLGRETIARMDSFASLLLPVVAALTAATGNIGMAAARQGATILFSDLLISTVDQLLMPLVYAYLAACCAYTAVGNEGLKRISELIRSGTVALLTALLVCFVGYLTASGAVAGSADAAAVKAAKFTISRAIPVVGGILSDAAETVLVGAGVLRGTVGIVGLLVVLAICLLPFLQLSVHYLVYKGTAALVAATAQSRLSRLIDSIGVAFGLVMGMCGACGLILMVSVISGITAVTAV